MNTLCALFKEDFAGYTLQWMELIMFTKGHGHSWSICQNWITAKEMHSSKQRAEQGFVMWGADLQQEEKEGKGKGPQGGRRGRGKGRQGKGTGHGIISSKKMRGSELTYTSLYGRELDRFLFTDTDKQLGAVLHQVPSRCQETTPEQADIIYIVKTSNFKPGYPILESDAKMQDGDIAKSVRQSTYLLCC